MQEINKEHLPKHIAIIMDGNGRWAKQKGAMRVFGHKNAIQSVRETTETCAELGVKYLTLYAFSTENWSRPRKEVDRKETDTLQKNNIRLLTIGATEQLPSICQKELREAIEITAQNTGLTLILALSYSGRWDIEQAVRQIAQKVEKGELKAAEINAQTIEAHLSTSGIPEPELMIRTSGEFRISNFLLWQLAYTEIYITQTLWPDFRKKDLYEAIASFQQRERRFGKTSEQIQTEKKKNKTFA